MGKRRSETNESRIEKFNRHILSEAFGDSAEDFLRERTASFAALDSECWKQRYCGIKFLLDHWNIDAEVLWPLYQSHFEKEDHIQVQLCTLKQVGALFRHTYNEHACRFLARISLSEKFENRIRIGAYDSINKIRSPPKIDQRFVHTDLDDLRLHLDGIKEKMKTRRDDRLPDWDLGLLQELASENG